MATLSVRSRSEGVRSVEPNRYNHAPWPNVTEPARTFAHTCMQKVEGSSPFIRFAGPAGNGGFFRWC